MSRTRCSARHSRFRQCTASGFRLIRAVTASWLLLLAWPLASHAAAPTPAQPVAIATILQGHVSVIRGMSQFDAPEGVRLLADDIVKTDEDTFLRLEYRDLSWLELGPQT